MSTKAKSLKDLGYSLLSVENSEGFVVSETYAKENPEHYWFEEDNKHYELLKIIHIGLLNKATGNYAFDASYSFHDKETMVPVEGYSVIALSMEDGRAVIRRMHELGCSYRRCKRLKWIFGLFGRSYDGTNKTH